VGLEVRDLAAVIGAHREGRLPLDSPPATVCIVVADEREHHDPTVADTDHHPLGLHLPAG
jgi:hypothetical protein